MCRYNIAIDDALMEEVRPSIGDGVDIMLSQRLRGIGTAPEGFDYKKELEGRFDQFKESELEVIDSIAFLPK